MADTDINAKERRSEMPERLGKCRVVGLLARGGYGWIYRAIQEPEGRLVALKVLPREIEEDSETATRFRREAASATRLDHPNIVKIFETGFDQGFHYIAMELVDGSNLERYAEARGGRLDEGEAARVILQAAEGLAYAHTRGIFHRDIKPSNLLVTPQGKVKIVDFGLAVVYDAETRLTQTGLCVGTPYFMSPERCQGYRGDARSDIYSLGVTLYVLTTGRMPFDYKEIADILHAHVRAPRPDPWAIHPDMTPTMRGIILRCMAKRPEERYQSAMELGRDLKPLSRGTTIFKASQMNRFRTQDPPTTKDVAAPANAAPAPAGPPPTPPAPPLKPDGSSPLPPPPVPSRPPTAQGRDARGAEPRPGTGPSRVPSAGPPPPPPPDWQRRPSSRRYGQDLRPMPPKPAGQGSEAKTPSSVRPVADGKPPAKSGGDAPADGKK